MPGSARMMRNASLVTQLESSAAAPSRITIRLSFEPEETTAEWTPFCSAIIEIITAMTTPMPRIVISVETRRAFRLPMLYLSGIIRPPSSDRRRRAGSRRAARAGRRRSGRLPTAVAMQMASVFAWTPKFCRKPCVTFPMSTKR